MNTATLPAPSADDPGLFEGDPALGWAPRLRAALAHEGAAKTLLLVAPGVRLEAFELALLRAALDEGMAGCASPVCRIEIRRAWGLPDTADAVLEAWTWSPHTPLEAAPDPRCTLWRRDAAERWLREGETAVRAVMLPCLAVNLPPTADAPRLPSGLRPEGIVLRLPPPTAAGRDGRPVVLHVLHSWGGGVERFVADAMRDDPSATHLALVSEGDVRGGHGQGLALHTALDRAPVRHWRIDPPLGDTGRSHPVVQAALEETIASFGVGAVRVSSLIGTSLDVLSTGLPTSLVLHDAFPFWPVLDDETPLPCWDEARLHAASLAPGWRFSARDAGVWRTRADATIAALQASGTQLVAPSQAALTRLTRLVPDALRAAARVIPHGLPPGDGGARPVQRRPGPLRVLVPGRLEGGKGERLLDALLPIAPSGIAWCFAGGGAKARDYATKTRGEAIERYAPEALPALVERFDPDLALLPSLLPETFGYVLSEMQALGVPVLAAGIGAYGERLAEMGGLPALEPRAEAFAAALAGHAGRPDALPRQLPPPPDLATARAAWRALEAPLRQRTRCLPGSAARLPTHREGVLNITAIALRQERDAAYLAHARDTDDLAMQRDIAMKLADQSRLDLASEKERRLWLERVLEESTRANQPLETQIAILSRERDEAYGFYERDTADLIRQRDTALSQRDAVQHQLDNMLLSLRHPVLRLPWALVRRGSDAAAAWRYRLHRGTDLAKRGLRSLRQRGLGPTWAAVRRRWSQAVTLGLHDSPPAAEGPLAFIAPAAARVSVVIPVYGKLEYTLACLRSLQRSGLPDDAEIIVVDDASPDESGTVLPAIPGLRYHRNTQNLGFVGSCNAGAALAHGHFLVFLNNDTSVTDGWLEALLSTFDAHPDTGLAGAQLVYPDGRLQESGGIVFSDGSGWNYGRFDDPRHPAYRFVREVDYCSGAAIALRTALFHALGGFDERYAPAYYEDTDLAMKVRDAGLKVRVQPASLVVHHEGITAGTDTGSGVKAYQVRNQQRFLERWGDTLRRRHPAPSQAAHYAAQHRARARVLVIDATTPMPDRDSGSVRLFELLRLLVDEACAVSFFPENGLDDGRYTQALRDLGVEAWTQPWLGALPDWLAKHGPRFQLIIVSRHYVLSPLLPLLRRHAPQARIVFDTVDLHHLREAREAHERGDAALLRAAESTRQEELALIAAVERTWVVSPVEKALLAESLPGATVDVVSNIHRVRGVGPAMGQRHGLLFVGGFRHPPNVDAARWLAEAILPRIRAVRPEIGLTLVGSDAPADVLALGAHEGVRVLGHVPELEPVLDAHRFSVAPLRYGAGVKGKVNQALAHGLPVVATSCAVEGMGLQHGVDALVADEADAFADTLLRAYDDEALWNRLVAGGLANTEREFSPERARQTLRTIFAELR